MDVQRVAGIGYAIVSAGVAAFQIAQRQACLGVRSRWAARFLGSSRQPCGSPPSYRRPCYSSWLEWFSRGLALHEAEIGPDKLRPQGPLGNLIEFGSINNPPHPGGLPAALREEPRFEKAAADAAEDAAGG